MKALVIAVYIGSLPELMPLWLKSAGRNPAVDFLVVSDQPTPDALPPNVGFRRMTLAEMRDLWSQQIGSQACLDRPYKLCDFKPLYWMLAPDFHTYDYWGFCDLDVIWGDLSRYLEAHLGHYDALFSEGHLRLFKNTAATRELYADPHMRMDWRAALSEPRIFGIDEHHGINHALHNHTQLSWRADCTKIADIDPGFRQMRRLPWLKNHKNQAFYWEDGRIYCEYEENKSLNKEEYIYIHLQKRHVSVDTDCEYAISFNIDPSGITPRTVDSGELAAIANRNPWHVPNIAEARILFREWRRRLLHRPTPIEPIDRIP